MSCLIFKRPVRRKEQKGREELKQEGSKLKGRIRLEIEEEKKYLLCIKDMPTSSQLHIKRRE